MHSKDHQFVPDLAACSEIQGEITVEGDRAQFFFIWNRVPMRPTAQAEKSSKRWGTERCVLSLVSSWCFAFDRLRPSPSPVKSPSISDFAWLYCMSRDSTVSDNNKPGRAFSKHQPSVAHTYVSKIEIFPSNKC